MSLRLQASATTDPAVRSALKETEIRVLALPSLKNSSRALLGLIGLFCLHGMVARAC